MFVRFFTIFWMVALPCFLFGQRIITGQVTDADSPGEALIGVNVYVKENPEIGTITDLDGRFELEVRRIHLFWFFPI